MSTAITREKPFHLNLQKNTPYISSAIKVMHAAMAFCYFHKKFKFVKELSVAVLAGLIIETMFPLKRNLTMARKEKFLLNVENIDRFCKTWIGSGDKNPEIAFFGIEFSSEARNEVAISSFFNEIHRLDYPELIADYTGFVTNHSRVWEPEFDFSTSRFGARNSTRRYLSGLAFCILKNQKLRANIGLSKEYNLFESLFANKNSRTATWELFPLPCAKIEHFPYAKWLDTANYNHFRSKEAYRDKYFEVRKTLFKKRLASPDLKYVIMYGTGNRRYFQKILELDLDECKTSRGDRFYFKKYQDRKFILTKHPAARGVSYEYFNEVLDLTKP